MIKKLYVFVLIVNNYKISITYRLKKRNNSEAILVRNLCISLTKVKNKSIWLAQTQTIKYIVPFFLKSTIYIIVKSINCVLD